MANEINYKIKISTDGEKSFQEIAVEAKSADEAIEKVVNTVNKASDKFKEMAATSLTLNNLSNAVQQLDSMFQGMVGSSQSFDASMRAVNTMAGKGEAEFEKLKGSVAELGKEIPKTREALADGLYQVISNGVPEDNWISFLDKSARASVGGIADLGQTVTVTSTIIKNYGMEWEAAAEIQDNISQTWGSIKGIGNSVESLTETLKGDGNAWEKVCGVMDGMLGLYEGIKGIVEIVQILTAVTTAHAAAKVAEAGSETTESGTLAANAAAAAADNNGLTVSGFATVYFYVTDHPEDYELDGVTYTNGKVRFAIRTTGSYSDNILKPMKAMAIVAYGNFTNESRQKSVYRTRTFTRFLMKQNTWDITYRNVAMQLGDVSGLSIPLKDGSFADLSGYSAYLNNVFFSLYYSYRS